MATTSVINVLQSARDELATEVNAADARIAADTKLRDDAENELQQIDAALAVLDGKKRRLLGR